MDERTSPEPGTWAFTARLMAEIFQNDEEHGDFDWDAWKDEMKEGE